MRTLEEDDLRFDFTQSLDAIKFDSFAKASPDGRAFSNWSKVDFIVEREDGIYFIEVKDPARPNKADKGNELFLNKIEKKTLGKKYFNKYMDTFMFRWAEGKLDKSIYLVALITLETGLLDSIERQIESNFKHLKKESNRWQRQPMAGCLVLNLKTWEETFPEWPIRRNSDTENQTSPGA